MTWIVPVRESAQPAYGLVKWKRPSFVKSAEVDTAYPEIRAMTNRDTDLQRNFFNALSPDSRYSRFMTPMSDVSRSLMRTLSALRPFQHVGLIATIQTNDQIKMVGEARCVLEEAGNGSAEFAIAVADKWQGHGLAGNLLRRLEHEASKNGIHRLIGITLNTNIRMKKLASRAGYRSSSDQTEARATRLVKSISDPR